MRILREPVLHLFLAERRGGAGHPRRIDRRRGMLVDPRRGGRRDGRRESRPRHRRDVRRLGRRNPLLLPCGRRLHTRRPALSRRHLPRIGRRHGGGTMQHHADAMPPGRVGGVFEARTRAALHAAAVDRPLVHAIGRARADPRREVQALADVAGDPRRDGRARREWSRRGHRGVARRWLRFGDGRRRFGCGPGNDDRRRRLGHGGHPSRGDLGRRLGRRRDDIGRGFRDRGLLRCRCGRGRGDVGRRLGGRHRCWRRWRHRLLRDGRRQLGGMLRFRLRHLCRPLGGCRHLDLGDMCGCAGRPRHLGLDLSCDTLGRGRLWLCKLLVRRRHLGLRDRWRSGFLRRRRRRRRRCRCRTPDRPGIGDLHGQLRLWRGPCADELPLGQRRGPLVLDHPNRHAMGAALGRRQQELGDRLGGRLLLA